MILSPPSWIFSRMLCWTGKNGWLIRNLWRRNKNMFTWYLFSLLISSVDFPENIGPKINSMLPFFLPWLLFFWFSMAIVMVSRFSKKSFYMIEYVGSSVKITQSTNRAFKILNWLKVWFGGAAGRRRESKGSEQSQRTCTGNESYLVTRHNVDCLTLWIAREITITIEFAVLY